MFNYQVGTNIIKLPTLIKIPEFNILLDNVNNIGYNNLLGDSSMVVIAKNKIEKVDKYIWTKIRKYINVYENPGYSLRIKPVSRAYYKLKEIIIDFNLINLYGDTFHIAESPGGFIQATIEKKSLGYSHINTCYTISIIDELNQDIPIYHHSIKNNNNVKNISNYIEDGKCDGDITNLNTIINTIRYFKKNNIKLSFITADGGINDNGEFEKKEIHHTNLIFCEIVLCLFLLEEDGDFIIKIFDIFTDITYEMIILLSSIFKEIYITKPLTSRYTNSEKYLVLKGFIPSRLDYNIRNLLINNISILNKNPNLVMKKLFINTPGEFLNKINDFNTYFTNNQIKYIETTIDYIDKSDNKKFNQDHKFEKLKTNLNKLWINKYNY